METIYTIQKDAFVEMNRLKSAGKVAQVVFLPNNRYQVVVIDAPKPKK